MMLTSEVLEQFQLQFQQQWQRVALQSYLFVNDLHSLVDEPQPLPIKSLHPVYKRITVCGIILSGTAVSSLSKLAYQLEAEGTDGRIHTFEKPWFLVMLMFLGMSLCLPLSLVMDLIRRSTRPWVTRQQLPSFRQVDDLRAPLLSGTSMAYEQPWAAGGAGGDAITRLSPPSSRPPEGTLVTLLLPVLFDLLGSALVNCGLLYLTASAAQMLRHSLLLFASGVAVLLYGKRLNGFHSCGLASCVVGLSMVAAASVLPAATNAAAAATTFEPPPPGALPGAAQVMHAVLLLLLSQLVQALQLLTDQGAAGRLALSPLKMVGCEGLLGLCVTALVLLPLLAHTPESWGPGLCEDTLDTLAQIRGSLVLQLLLLLLLGSLQLYNICGMVVSGELDAAGATYVQAARTLLVWCVGAGIHELPPGRLPQRQGAAPLGEPLGAWSWLQAAGFGVLLAAVLCYGRGDRWRLQKQMQAEARLLMLDQPPSTSPPSAYGGSVHGGSPHTGGASAGGSSSGRFRAHMDVDYAPFVRSMAAPAPPAMRGLRAASGGSASVFTMSPGAGAAGSATELDAASGGGGTTGSAVPGAGLLAASLGASSQGHGSVPHTISLGSWPPWAQTAPP